MRKGRPKQTTDYLVKLSVFLDSIKVKLFEIYLDLKLTHEEISVARIKNIYLGKDENHYTLLGVIDMAIEKFAEELAPGSIKNYYTTRAYVEMFCKTRYKTGDVRLKHLTYPFIDELKSFILNTPIKTNDRCTTNGCMKHLERLKKIITWAFRMRYTDRDVFDCYKIRKVPSEEGRRLTWKQVKDLERRTFATDKRSNISIAYSTITDWVRQVANVITPLGHLQLHEMYQQQYWHGDETGIAVLDNKVKKDTPGVLLDIPNR